MGSYRTIDDLGDLKGKRVFVRADLNMPIENGQVSDDSRAKALAPTVKDLRKRGAKIILASHFGRPKGKVDQTMSLFPIVSAVEKALGERLVFCSAWKGKAAQQAIRGASSPILLENMRFDPGEETNDPAFAAELAELCDVFVNDAFSVSHRAHASTQALPRLVPAAAGRAVEREIDALEVALSNPQRPVAALVGGAKVSTKLAVLHNLVDKVDHLIIGGAMANTFLAAQGYDVGKSLCERDLLDTATGIMNAADAAGCRIHLPSDVALAKELKANTPHRTAPIEDIEPDEMILDLGNKSVKALGDLVVHCKTILWNGPLGAFEFPPFDQATNALAQNVGRMTDRGDIISVAGGGDTVAALARTRSQRLFTFVSTAGGAFLEWLEGKELPGLAVLKK